MSDRAFRRWMAFCTVIALLVLGVGTWAVIKVVTWLTGQAL